MYMYMYDGICKIMKFKLGVVWIIIKLIFKLLQCFIGELLIIDSIDSALLYS